MDRPELTVPKFTAAEWGFIANILGEYAQAPKRTLLKREQALAIRRRIVDSCRSAWEAERSERAS